MPRLFIALDLPPPPRAALAALRAEIPGARWVAPEQLHLTLRFLGQVAEDRVADLCAQLATVSAAAFQAQLEGVGVFPPVPTRRKPARVLWAGIAPPDPVRALKEAVDKVLGPDPESADQAFSPHVTLARFKEPPRPEALADYLGRHRALAGAPFPVGAFVLYQSRTLASGSVYTPLASYRLT
jgi:RNA 2',3'-cyclic 3'-phosphodiesterase